MTGKVPGAPRKRAAADSISAVSTQYNGVWRSLAARYVRDVEAAGPNPATPTSSLFIVFLTT